MSGRRKDRDETCDVNMSRKVMLRTRKNQAALFLVVRAGREAQSPEKKQKKVISLHEPYSSPPVP